MLNVPELKTSNEYDNFTDLNTTNDYNNGTYNCTINESNIDIIIPTLIFTIPCGLSFLCLMSLMVYTIIEPLFNIKWMEKFFYPTHPVRCIIRSPSECANQYF